MGNKKTSNKERDKQITHLFENVYNLGQELRMVRTLLENYIIWNGNVEKFTEYLQEEQTKRKPEAGQEKPSKRSGAAKTSGKTS
tara:strand:+ start:308 stop:559 length:252 start_codon:yes stop_codon:yes gene_type:complete